MHQGFDFLSEYGMQECGYLVAFHTLWLTRKMHRTDGVLRNEYDGSFIHNGKTLVAFSTSSISFFNLAFFQFCEELFQVVVLQSFNFGVLPLYFTLHIPSVNSMQSHVSAPIQHR